MKALRFVRMDYDDGPLYDLYRADLTADGALISLEAEPIATVENLNDAPVLADMIGADRSQVIAAQEAGAIPAEHLVARGFW